MEIPVSDLERLIEMLDFADIAHEEDTDLCGRCDGGDCRDHTVTDLHAAPGVKFRFHNGTLESISK